MEFLWGCLTIILVIKAEIILNKSYTWCFVRKKWQYCIKIRAKIFAVCFTWLSPKLNVTQSTLLNIPTFAAVYSNISHRYCIFAEIISLMEDKDFNRIKVVLVEHKRTARWLSEALGKDPATVSKWCTNTTQPSLETLFRISELLQVPVLELIKKQNI